VLNPIIPKPESLYLTSCQNGANVEGRQTRSGGSSMKIGALAKYLRIDQLNIRDTQVDLLPFPVKEISYRVAVKTFVPLSLFSEYKRYDTIGFWILSYQEILRHLALADSFTRSTFWKPAVEIIQASKDTIWDIVVNLHDNILHYGDKSYEHWLRYVNDHGQSATPWGEKWDSVLQSQGTCKLLYDLINRWSISFNDYMHTLKNRDLLFKVVNAKYCYPGVRARPPDYRVLSDGPFERVLFASKWRDRKVGGIIGLSQYPWVIYKSETKIKVLKEYANQLEKFSGFKIHFLEIEGPQMFLDLRSKHVFTYDLKTAEKQTGMLFAFLGYSADLSDHDFHQSMAPNYIQE